MRPDAGRNLTQSRGNKMNTTTKQLNMLNRILNVETNHEIRKLSIKENHLQKKLDRTEKLYQKLQARLAKLEA